MAKQSPTRVLSELQDLEKWLLLMNIDVALVDANQCAFSRDGRPATLGQGLPCACLAGTTLRGHVGHCPTSSTGSLSRLLGAPEGSFSPLQITSHGTWNAEADDLELSQKDKGWHRPVFLVIQQGRHGTGWRDRAPSTKLARRKRQREKAKKRKREREHDPAAPTPLPALQDQLGQEHETSEGQTGNIDATGEGSRRCGPSGATV